MLSDLAPGRRRPRKKRLSKRVEAIIQNVIETRYLTLQKRIQKAVIEEVRRRCKAAHVKPPSANTIRERVRAVDEREKMKRREGKKAARDRFDEVKAAFPGADWPLAVVQIDHTPLDIELVDDETRQPIGRPWLTLGIDVFSRMVTGFYLSLDPPSAFSVGMCIRHSVLGKEGELARLGVEGEWPVWGLMQTLHADNGKDFRSNTIQRACDEYGINIEWRPVRTPHWGAHIERLLGTLNKEIHALPGTTFSNTREKGDYDSAKNATMTLDELTRWLVTLIVRVYHVREHKALKKSPLERWREGILGDGRRAGTGLPEPIADARRFHLDFLPYTERTVQREGIAWDNVWYFHDTLRPWINAAKGGQKVKFKVRRDPRDISRIYFLDPKLGDYLEVPYRDIVHPSISLWELRAATKHAKRQGTARLTEYEIFAARAEMERIEEQAAKETRRTRRQAQRKRTHSTSLAREKGEQPPAARGAEGPRLVVDNEGAKFEPEEEIFEFTEEELEPRGEEWI